MERIPFTKYTSFGNNFVIVDEVTQRVLTENDKRRFAYHATDGSFGVGSDNFLVVQRCTPETLQEINSASNYWENVPNCDADFIFRMFEPDGSEALSCGNGLMCIARHLNQRYGLASARILTEIPSAMPKTVCIGAEVRGDGCFANLGHPRRMPQGLIGDLPRKCLAGGIDAVDALTISQFRKTDEALFLGTSEKLELRGYLVFTGEPHLVIFVEEGVIPQKPVEYLFHTATVRSQPYIEKRISTGMDLVRFIGNHFNKQNEHLFPKGININFVQTISHADSLLEYRCFERGINKETLACGTGALACAYVAHKLNKVSTREITVWPYLCQLHQKGAKIKVQNSSEGWTIFGSPTCLVDGIYAPTLHVPMEPQLPFAQIQASSKAA